VDVLFELECFACAVSAVSAVGGWLGTWTWTFDATIARA